MIRFFRFSPSRLALVYIALSVFVLALFAIPLWYAWRANISTFRAYVQGEDMQRLVDIFHREGAKGLATAMESQARSLPGDEIMVFADASKLRLAGNLPAWPAEVPDLPGTYGLVIGLGDGSTMRVVASHVRLPGGYHLLMGRESVRFESLVERFWYGISGAMVIVVVLGAVIGWLSHRALLSEVDEISRTASAIVEGDLSRRVATRGGSPELDTLARTVNGMLEQLARQNVQLEGEIAVRRQAHLWFLESMDQVNRAIQATNDLEQMMSDVLDAVISIFNCDRAWLVYPCDPEAASWKVPMEHARPEFPGAFVLGLDLPIDPEIAKVFQTVRASSAPVRFGPGSEHPLPAETAKRFSIQSVIAMAIYPKGDKPYMLGLHQCSYPRVWTPQEERLFQEIGRRLEDALTSLLMFRNLGESERKLEEAQRFTHVGYWERDVDTDLITWSDETYRIFGLEPQARTLSLAQLPELIHPEDKQIMVQAMEEALRGNRRYDVEYRVVRPNGEVRIVHSRGNVIRDESGRPRRNFGTVQDITERKQAELRLMAQHTVTQILAQAATLQEATPKILRAVCEYLVWDLGALWSRDHEAGVLRCVEAWHKGSVEVPEFEATSRATTFIPGTGLPGRVWSSREPTYIPDIANDASFPRAPIAAREGLHAAFGFPILLGGDVLGVMEFFSHEIRQPDHDLLAMMATIGSQIGQFIERKRAEDALHHAQAELAHVTRVATLGEMTASIAHEINQPLAAVVNNASACLRWLAGPTPNLEEARQSAALITADGHRAGEIIGRIRALAKKASSRKDWIDINETILEVIALARSEVHSNGVSLQTRLGDDMPLILGDRIQLQQVILNLIINAIEAMSGVGENPRELVVRSEKDGSQRVLVAVRDSGPGLDPKSLDHLFTAFFTTKPKGMGMGLAISRSIIEAHGGRLWAVPNDGPGATFQFTLDVGSKEGPLIT
jgi:PAS domain S-box-containing protein